MSKPTHLALLKELAEFLNEETEIQSMLEGAINYLIKGSDFTTGWIFFIDDEGYHTLEADYALPKALSNHSCKYLKEDTCWCVQAYHRQKLTKASNIINCSRINYASREFENETDHITHHATVPLRSGQEQFGLLNVATPHTTIYSDEDLELLESVAFQIGSAIKRIYLTDQEKEAARINERNRLARDLHDSVNQMLFSLKLTAHAASQITKESTSQKAFTQIEQTSQNAVNEMRALIWQLKPVGLENGLVSALKEYAKVVGMTLLVEVHGLIQLENQTETHIYRIIQEAINNTKKHAGTDVIHIDISQGEKIMTINIWDEGTGFDMTQVDFHAHHGLTNMKQRLNVLNGNIEIDSQNGTQIKITIPVET